MAISSGAWRVLALVYWQAPSGPLFLSGNRAEHLSILAQRRACGGAIFRWSYHARPFRLHCLFIAAIGLLSGILFDAFERFLKKNNLSLEECLPRGQENYLAALGSFLLQRFRETTGEKQKP